MSRIGMIVAIVAVLTGFTLGGCRSVIYVPEEHVTHDSVYVTELRVDSVYWRDSVFVAQRGDTVTVTREKYRYRYKLLRDTVWVERVDSVTVIRPVQVEKPMRWYDKGFVWIGRLCCIAFLLWLIFLYLRRRG